MKRAQIRKATAAHLAALGYPREWYEWPKNKPGQLYWLLQDTTLRAIRLAAPMPKYKFRAAMAAIPRRGPALVYKTVTSRSWRQPDLEAIWARPGAPHVGVDVRGHMGEAIEPPTLADKRGRR